MTRTIAILLLFSGLAPAWTMHGGGDHLGANWVLGPNDTISGYHYNINRFVVPSGQSNCVYGWNGGDTTGHLRVVADTILIVGTLEASGRGYGGGGGGMNDPLSGVGGFGGVGGKGGKGDSGTYNRVLFAQSGGGGGGSPYGPYGRGGYQNGQTGTLFSGGRGGNGNTTVGGNGGVGYGGGGGGGGGYFAGGGGGGGGGTGGANAPWQAGGIGAGAWRGSGGAASTGSSANAGQNGGYLATNANGDATNDSSVVRGSGGGGSGSTSNGSYGGGGAGGGAGGAAIRLEAQYLSATGGIFAQGAGGGQNGGPTFGNIYGGGGAGGGLALCAKYMNLAGIIDVRGRQTQTLSTQNAGTIKIFYGGLSSSATMYYGRLLQRQGTFRDVSVMRIMAPTGSLDSGVAITPACSILNYGSRPDTYQVHLRIGPFYDESTLVAGHPSRTVMLVTFPDWGVLQRGTHAVTCSASLAPDERRENDRALGSVAVYVHDVGVLAIANPAGSITPGPLTPRALVHNYGAFREPVDLVFRINSPTPYYELRHLAGGLPQALDTVIEFPVWQADTGTFVARCSIWEPGDYRPMNDTASFRFRVAYTDVAANSIEFPVGTVESSDVVVPAGKLANYGDFDLTFMSHFIIYDDHLTKVYAESTLVIGLSSQTESLITFPTWPQPHHAGQYLAVCSVKVSGDRQPANDTSLLVFRVNAPRFDTGWSARADLPLGRKGKRVKDGGALAHRSDELDRSDTACVFALRGNNTLEFYAYNTRSNAWATRESVPAVGRAGKKKMVKKGSTMTAGTGRIYAAKGNNTVEFWAYNPNPADDYPWTQLADIPLGARALKEGTGSVAVAVNDTEYVYLLKGSGTTEFYRYNVTANSWQSRTGAPLGTSGKTYKNGSALVANEDGTKLFALKGSYNEFHAYLVDSDRWVTRAGLPLVGSTGKKKKVKDGASLARVDSDFYALKGGNTREFWFYRNDSDRWEQRSDLPAGTGKNVKGGGALVYVNDPEPLLFALKGNNTTEFYRYRFSVADGERVTGPAVLGGVAFRTPQSAIRIAPNPFSTATTISYSLPTSGRVSLRLYDITGKLVTTLSRGSRHSGVHTISVDRRSSGAELNPGVYILRLDTGTSTSTARLVVE